MALLPASASASTLNTNPTIADLFTKPLPRPRFDTLIGDAIAFTPPSTSVAPTVDSSATGVASDSVHTTTSVGPSIAPTLPIVLDTGSSYSRAPSALDFSLEIAQASYGLFRSSTTVISKALATKALASTPVDPCTLITGEDAIDLSCPDIDSDYIDSDSGSSFTKVTFDIRDFGTATLTFIYSRPTSELIHIFVDPTQVDWLHWVPLPRLTPTESYFHIFGRDYLQTFALYHLIPLWIALVSALLRSE